MNRAMLFAGIMLAVAAMASAARADSTSELLEKGIYTEETTGDLDKAITIYEKVIAQASASHLLAAKAQYHLAQCLLKKGKKAEATVAFEKLINDFPEAKDLVAKARERVPAGLSLAPVPWGDGEALQLRFRMATGLDIGTMVYTMQSADLAGRKVWRVGSRTFVTLNQMNGHSWVDADWDTFRPIQSEFQNSLLGTTLAKYSENQANVTSEGADGKVTKREVNFSRVIYDNEQAMDVIRRLPLAPGYKVTLPLLGIGGGDVQIPLEVRQPKETVKVPAGEFECFNVHLGLVNQTFWFATDPHRYLVKFSANGVDAELISISQNKAGEPRRYKDDKLGISLAAPNDWFFYAAAPLDKKHLATVFLLDPPAVSVIALHVDKPEALKAEKGNLLHSWADEGIDEARKIYKDFKLRADGRQERTVGGLPALSALADYTDGKRKMVAYVTYVEAKAAGLELQFGALIPREQFDGLRKPLDKIMESLKVEQP